MKLYHKFRLWNQRRLTIAYLRDELSFQRCRLRELLKSHNEDLEILLDCITTQDYINADKYRRLTTYSQSVIDRVASFALMYQSRLLALS